MQAWWIVQSSLFAWSPQCLYGFRAWLLRLFGASIGKHTIIRPTVRVTYPWKVKIGDYAWVGDSVELYSLGIIQIGAHAVVSQRSYLCAGDHDCFEQSFPIRSRDVIVEEQAWLATDVFVAPGVIIGRGAVVGARSSVFSDMPTGMICMGSPCKPVKPRVMRD